MSRLEGSRRKAHGRPTGQEKEEKTGAVDVGVKVTQSDPGLSSGVQQPLDLASLGLSLLTGEWGPNLYFLWLSLAFSEVTQGKHFGRCL